MLPFPVIKNMGATPGANTNTTVLFATNLPAAPTNAMNANRDGMWGETAFGLAGATKFVLDLKHSHGGTLNSYKSNDRGATWKQLSSDQITPASIGTTHVEFLVGAFRDWKLEWVNGGTAQDPWIADMCLGDDPLEIGTSEPLKFSSLGAATTANVKSGPGRLYGITANNRNAAVRYLQIFDSTAGTGTVLYQWPVAATAGTITIGDDFFTPAGWAFATGITWGMSTTAGSYVAATAGETDVAGSYR